MPHLDTLDPTTARRAAGRTQKDAARLLGIGFRSLQRYEAGKAPAVDLALSLAKLYSLTDEQTLRLLRWWGRA